MANKNHHFRLIELNCCTFNILEVLATEKISAARIVISVAAARVNF